MARCKEFDRGPGEAGEQLMSMEPAVPSVMAPVLVLLPETCCAAHENELTGRSRPVLTLKRA